MIPCSDETSIENTYCRHPNQEKSEVCPITSISFERIGKIVDSTSIILEWSNQLDLVFSRDNDANPISETRIEELQPCMATDGYRLSNTKLFVEAFEQTNFFDDCETDDRWQQLSEFKISEYAIASSSDLL